MSPSSWHVRLTSVFLHTQCLREGLKSGHRRRVSDLIWSSLTDSVLQDPQCQDRALTLIPCFTPPPTGLTWIVTLGLSFTDLPVLPSSDSHRSRPPTCNTSELVVRPYSLP